MAESAVEPIPEGMHVLTPHIGDSVLMLMDEFPEWGTLGHRWSIATHTRDLTPDQLRKGMEGMGSDAT